MSKPLRHCNSQAPNNPPRLRLRNATHAPEPTCAGFRFSYRHLKTGRLRNGDSFPLACSDLPDLTFEGSTGLAGAMGDMEAEDSARREFQWRQYGRHGDQILLLS